MEETLLLLIMILMNVSAIIVVCKKLHKPRKLYFCKDIPCVHGVEYCCYSCGQRKICECPCDHELPCDWRDECE